MKIAMILYFFKPLLLFLMVTKSFRVIANSISDISVPARASIGLDLDLKENQLEINASEDAA